MTLGAFTPRYMPNYRIVEIHGPNRIVVRDKKGIESMRRSSHLKVCELKDKMATMVPDDRQVQTVWKETRNCCYTQKMSQISSLAQKLKRRAKFSPEVEISMINVTPVTSNIRQYRLNKEKR